MSDGIPVLQILEIQRAACEKAWDEGYRAGQADSLEANPYAKREEKKEMNAR